MHKIKEKSRFQMSEIHIIKEACLHMPVNGKDTLQGIVKSLYEQKLISYEEYLRALARIEADV